MSAKKKEYKPIAFTIADGDLKGKYQIRREQVHIPKVGIVKAEDLAKDSKMLAHLVSIGSGVIEKVEK